MAWKEVTVDFLIAKITGGKVRFGSTGTYKSPPNAIDLLDADIPPWGAVKSILGAYTGGVPVSFVNKTGLTINWQTDEPPGFAGSTYASIFGNMYPKPFVFLINGQRLDHFLTVTRIGDGSIANPIDQVIFDWTTVQTGTIQF